MQESPVLGSENDPTLEGSFSSVSKPIFATKYSFFKHFSRSTRFTHLRTAPNSKYSQEFGKLFVWISAKNHKFLVRCRWFLLGISLYILENVKKSSNFKIFWRNVRIFLNSDRILPEFWCAKVRMVRSVADRTFQPCPRPPREALAGRSSRRRSRARPPTRP